MTRVTDLTRVAGYPSEATQADDWDDCLPYHYQERVGFQSVGTFKQTFHGHLQEALSRDKLDEMTLDGSGLVIGVDKRLYEPRQGLIDCMAPAVVKGEPGSVYVSEVDWDSFPPLEELASLFDQFFSKYTREVLMIVGKKRDGSGWLYHIPKQEGSLGLVTWKSTDGEMDWFSRQARWIGTIHIHPGNDCTPSTTDIDDWAEPEKSGLHVIFGRDQDFTVNGAIAGRTFELNSGSLKGVKRDSVLWTTSGRRPLGELLLQPKPVKVFSYKKGRTLLGKKEQKRVSVSETPADKSDDFVTWVFSQGGMLKIGQGQLGSMRIVFHQGSYYLVTLSRWIELQEWAKNLVDIPKAKRLAIYPVKGGNV